MRLPNVTVRQPFAAVVTDYGPVVMRVCRAVLGPVDADDAWSETFLSAMKAYPDLPAGANLEAWLVTIAHRKAIDVTRARTSTHPDRPTARHRESGAARSRRRSGPGRATTQQKRAVAYHCLAGLPYADVADLLGGSADAARRAAADGIASLRRTHTAASAESGIPRKGDTA